MLGLVCLLTQLLDLLVNDAREGPVQADPARAEAGASAERLQRLTPQAVPAAHPPAPRPCAPHVASGSCRRPRECSRSHWLHLLKRSAPVVDQRVPARGGVALGTSCSGRS